MAAYSTRIGLLSEPMLAIPRFSRRKRPIGRIPVSGMVRGIGKVCSRVAP